MATKTTSYTPKSNEDHVTKDPTPPSVSEYTKGNAGTPYNSHETSHDVSNTNPTSKAALTIDQAPKSIDAQIKELLVQQKDGFFSPEDQAKLADLQKQKEAQGSLKQKNPSEAVDEDKDKIDREGGRNLIDFLYEKYYEALLYKICDWGRDLAAYGGGLIARGLLSSQQSIKEWRRDVKAKNKKISTSKTFDIYAQARKIRNDKIYEFYDKSRNEIKTIATVCNAIRNGSLVANDKFMEKFEKTVRATGNPEAETQIDLVKKLCNQYATGNKKERSAAKKSLKAISLHFGKQYGEKIKKEKIAFLAANDLTAATIMKRLAEDVNYVGNTEELKQAYEKQLATDRRDILNAGRYEINGTSPKTTILTKIGNLASKAYKHACTTIEDGFFGENGEKPNKNVYIERCNRVVNGLTEDPNSIVKTDPQVSNDYSNYTSMYDKSDLKQAAITYKECDEYFTHRQEKVNNASEQIKTLRGIEPSRRQRALNRINKIKQQWFTRQQPESRTPAQQQQLEQSLAYRMKATGHNV